MIKGVIFDLDGVIVSTDNLHYKAWKKIADEEGIYFDYQINDRLRGVSRMDSIEIIMERATRKYSQEEKFALAEKKNGFYVESLGCLSEKDLLPGVKETLTNLKAMGIKIALGSASKNAKTILNYIGLGDAFDAVSDGNNITKGKPDPQVFLMAAEMLGLEPTVCAVVEDSSAGIEAAIRGGMKPFAVGAAATEMIAGANNLGNVFELIDHVKCGG